MKLTNRESFLLIIAVATLLFGLTSLFIRPKIEEWKNIEKRIEDLKWQLDQDRKLIAEKDRWQEEFKKLRDAMPVFPSNKKMDVHWLQIIDKVAEKHNVRITKRQAYPEEAAMDIYELPIECSIESSLESLVKFIFDMENENIMLSFREVSIKPQSDGSLRTRFLLYCAYRKEQQKETPEVSNASK